MRTYAEEPNLIRQHTTAYCTGTTTASGKAVREGHAATNRERMGMTAIIYADNEGKPGEILGYWECEDTGKGKIGEDGKGAIEKGLVIDIYKTNLDRCKEWMKETGGKVWVQYIQAEG